MRRTILGGLAGLAAGIGAARAEAPMWRVEGAHAVVTLVSTAPSNAGDVRWRSGPLLSAAEGAREIWFLAPLGLPDPLTALRMLATLQTKGRLPDDQKLSPLLSSDGRARLARLASRDGIAIDKLDRMTPWNAQITLSLATRKREGSLKGLPIERFVLGAAPHASTHGFENLESDLKLLISTPVKEQVYNLEEAMRRYEDPALNARYVEAWEAGDLSWIQREREDKLRDNAPATWRTMQLAPRRRWVDQILAMSQGDKNVLVALDAANYVGPEGLPTLLRKRGIEVKGP